MPENKKDVQYRYYEMPPNSYVLALLGKGWIRPYGCDIEAQHFHNYMEIGYCYSGNGVLEFGEETIPYQGGHFSIIPANFLHHTIAKENTSSRWEYLFLDVETFLADTYIQNPHLGQKLLTRVNQQAHYLKHSENKKMAAIILELMEIYREKSELYLECAKGLLWALLVQIAELSPEKSVAHRLGTVQNENTSGSKNNAIVRAMDYVEKHYREKIQISELAAACHLSETHFRRVFGQSMHMSPLEYINLVRVEAACRLLRTTNDPIQDIALHCGFSTLPSFNRNFKDYTGTTPQQWRKDTAYYERQLEKQHIMVFNGWQ